ncbi:MAG: ABC transporter substrate-binding protein, partial [Firmicutes bacterium]|nr:ABC transporter substrate-binding protein [Bacillota bacterium]
MVFTFAACGGGESADTGEDQAEADTIVLGYIGPLTGESAIWGMVESYACQMLVDKTNEEGGIIGKQIELKIYDNSG